VTTSPAREKSYRGFAPDCAAAAGLNDRPATRASAAIVTLDVRNSPA